MPAVRTDYFTPMSQRGEMLGQAVSNVGQTIGNTVTRIPEMKQKQEEYDMKIEEFRNNKEFRISEIESLKGQAQEFGKKVGMPAKQYEAMGTYFENLKKAPAAQAEKKLKNISFYLGNYANMVHEAKNDPTMSGILEMFNEKVGPSDWDDDAEITAIGKQFDGWKTKRKKSEVYDWASTYIKENTKPDQPPPTQQEAYAAYVSYAATKRGGIDVADAKPIIDEVYMSQKDVWGHEEGMGKAKDRDQERKIREKALGLKEKEAADKGAKSNEKAFMDIRKETNGLIAKTASGLPYEPGNDTAKDATVRQNLITMTLLSKGMTVQEASTKAAEIDKGLDSAPAKKAQILDYLKNKETVESSPGLFDKLGKLISGLVSSSSQGVGRTNAAIPGTPTAGGQGSSPSSMAETPEQRKARLRSALQK